MSTNSECEYSRNEEIANSLSHLLGVMFGLVAFVLLLDKAFENNADALTIASMVVYSLSIIVLFLASTLYHSIPNPKIKRTLKLFDHCAIYLLIAGSYTPFLLVGLRTPLSVGLMAIIWLLAVCGILFKIVFISRFEKLSLATYLTMGWLSLIVIYQLVVTIPVGGVILLVVGGVIYSLGVIFYMLDRMPFNHAIWHGFVLAGCISHFLAIYYYVEPI